MSAGWIAAGRCAAGLRSDDRGGCVAVTEFVDQAYAGDDSDGSRARPWKTLRDGVRAAAAVAAVAVAEGRYAEDVVISGKPVRLRGRCARRVEVVGSGIQSAAVAVRGELASGSEVSGLSVTGRRTGILLRDARSVTLDAVHVHEAPYLGVVWPNAEGGAMRDSQPAAAGDFGRGINVQTPHVGGRRGSLALRSSVVEDNHDVGVYVSSSDAVIESSIVRATHEAPS